MSQQPKERLGVLKLKTGEVFKIKFYDMARDNSTMSLEMYSLNGDVFTVAIDQIAYFTSRDSETNDRSVGF